MRIAQVMEWNFSEPGGVQSHISGLCKQLRDYNNYVIVIAKKRVRETKKYPYKVYYIKPPFSTLPILFPVKANDIYNIIKAENVDLVHIHHIFTPISISAANAAQKANVPFIFTNHTLPYFSNKKTLLKTLILYRKILNKASKIISVSKAADKVVGTLVENKDKRIVIPNGVDARLFTPGDASYVLHSICFVGRLVPRKGAQILIDAFSILKKEVSDAKLFIIGDGRYKERLVSRVEREMLKDVEFTGYLPLEETVRYYQSCEVVVVPSLERESFGIVALEGMACAKPVIASDVGGLSEIITDRKDGLIVKRGDVYSLYKAMLDLFNSPEIAKKMGRIGRKKVEEKYDWKPVTKRILTVYKSVLKRD